MTNKKSSTEANSSLFTLGYRRASAAPRKSSSELGSSLGLHEPSLKKVAALLTVFNRKETTLRCLTQLYGQLPVEGCEVGVFLTDDGCTDGTAEAVREAFPKVHIVQGDGTLFWNRGMIAAWLAAAQHQDYDYYLWLNDDTELEDGALQRLMDCARATDGRTIIAGSCHAIGDSTKMTYGGLRKNGTRIMPDEKETKPCDTFNGNIVLVPRAVYDILGTNDPYYHHGSGDFDYGLRAGEAGLTSIVAPGFYGACNRHERIGKWADKSLPFSVRWKNFNSPTGAAPREMFHYRRRHFGLVDACSRFVSCHIHVCFPWLWSEKRVMEIKVKS